MAVVQNTDEAGVPASALTPWNLLDFLSILVDVKKASHATFRDHGGAIRIALEGVDVHSLALVAILPSGLVFPDDFFGQSDLLGLGPGIVEEDVPVIEEMDVVMARVPPLGAGSVVLPQDRAIHLADGHNIFSV